MESVRSGTAVNVMEPDAVSLLVLTSPPPATVAVSGTEPVAFAAKVTGMVTVGSLAAALKASARVQVTVWLEVEQVQPVPVAFPGTIDAGKVSTTETVPVVAAPPELEAVSV